MVLSIFLPSLHLDICNTLGTILDPRKVIFGHLIDFGHFPIEAEIFLGRAFQLSWNDNKNSFEILMAKEMGLDRAPIEF